MASAYIPKEIILDIIDHCEVRTLLTLRLVAKWVKQAVENNPLPRTELCLNPWDALPAWDDISRVVAGPALPPGFTIRLSERMRPLLKYDIKLIDAWRIYLVYGKGLGFIGQMFAVQTPRTRASLKLDGLWELPLSVKTEGITYADMIERAHDIARRQFSACHNCAGLKAESRKRLTFKFE